MPRAQFMAALCLALILAFTTFARLPPTRW
jgi:hypothetical protein